MENANQLSHVYPADSAVNGSDELEIGGCSVSDLAAEFGTPAYFVAEDDLRTRARTFRGGLRAVNSDSDVMFAAKSFPCTGVLRVIAEEDVGCLVASAGELAIAMRAGFEAPRITFHGNAKSLTEITSAVAHQVGTIILDSFDDIDRCEQVLESMGATQNVLVRITPDVSGDTHHAISTGQADSKFGFGVADAAQAIDRVSDSQRMRLMGLHSHIGSQLFELEPFTEAVAVLATLGDFQVYDFGGGLAASYLEAQEAPSLAGFVQNLGSTARAALGPDHRLVIEPGRSLVANSTVTVYTVETVKQNVSKWVAVDGGMSDNPRPMLYDARYEAAVATRMSKRGTGEVCHLAGKHCESGDVIVRDVRLDDPRPGDLIVTPATGAYGYAMASNYNGVPRAPVVLCKDGNAQMVSRRETIDDLFSRDV